MNDTTESVLVVDDEQLIRDILVRIVAREGYRVDHACDGVEAMEKLNDAPFDYVISDIKMPNMDGMQLLEQVKSLYPSVKVLLITGQAGTVSVRKAKAAGADSFITKPFKKMEIARTLAELSLQRRRFPSRHIPEDNK